MVQWIIYIFYWNPHILHIILLLYCCCCGVGTLFRYFCCRSVAQQNWNWNFPRNVRLRTQEKNKRRFFVNRAASVFCVRNTLTLCTYYLCIIATTPRAGEIPKEFRSCLKTDTQRRKKGRIKNEFFWWSW